MKDVLFTVEHNKPLSESIFELKLYSSEKLEKSHCGQFLHLKVNDNSILLRRPFCLYKFDDHSVTLLIAKVGKGSRKIAELKAGEKVLAVTPIGNGFTLDETHKKIALIGGGVGGAPLYSVPVCYPDKEYYSFLGFADKKSVMLEDDFKSVSKKLIVSTDDGSYGFKGYVTDAFKAYLKEFRPDVILTCGSEPMLKAVAKVAYDEKIPAYMSGESRMACGVGACLVCACAIKDASGNIKHKRACVDGPVFSLEDVIL